MRALVFVILFGTVQAEAKVNWNRVFNEVIIPCAAGVVAADIIVQESGDTRNTARIAFCGIVTGTAQHTAYGTGFGSGKSRSELEKQLKEWEDTPALQNLMPPK